MRANRPMENKFRVLKDGSPVETGIPKPANAASREPTGELIRCEEVAGPAGRELAGRGNAPQSSGLRNPLRETRPQLGEPQAQRESKRRRAGRKVAQKEHALPPCSCSNPDCDDRATSTASNCSTASPVPALSPSRSRTRTPRERSPAPLEKLA